jgi:hypothetical protein
VTTDDDGITPVVVVTFVVLALAGFVFGVIGSFEVPYRLPHGLEGLTAVVALLGNVLLGGVGGIGTRRPAGALAPAIGWLVGLGITATYAPGGDVIIPGSLATDPGVPKVGIALLLLGLLGAAIGVFLTHRYAGRPRRGYTPTPAPPT